MGLLSPTECAEQYVGIGRKKAAMPLGKSFLLAILAGIFIALGGAVTNTAVHSVANVGLARVLSGLLFPFGLAMVVLTGAELFTGNTLMVMSVLGRQISPAALLRSWCVVYLGNAVGAVATAAACAFSGQLNYSDGALAVFSIRLAAQKCAIPFGNSVISGIFCNLLVTTGVLLALSAKDLPGRVMGAYLPVAFFVICGFEHCVANLFYVPVGLFAAQIPQYAASAAAAGVALEPLTAKGFLLGNLLPVTLGNLIGGMAMGAVFWWCHARKEP